MPGGEVISTLNTLEKVLVGYHIYILSFCINLEFQRFFLLLNQNSIMYTKEQLDFAYKYPFSDEAREIIKGLNANEIEQRYLIIGKARIDEALQNDKVEYRESDYGKLDFVVGYAYARMLVSSLKNLGVITKYAKAEAKRACDALAKDTDSNLIRLAKELDLRIKQDGGNYSIIFTQFLSNTPNEEGFTLSNHKLSDGVVALDRSDHKGDWSGRREGDCKGIANQAQRYTENCA